MELLDGTFEPLSELLGEFLAKLLDRLLGERSRLNANSNQILELSNLPNAFTGESPGDHFKKPKQNLVFARFLSSLFFLLIFSTHGEPANSRWFYLHEGCAACSDRCSSACIAMAQKLIVCGSQQ